ncbi:MAG TPA: hypothetical protein VL948_21450 [Verrucomicrobiae bacterium]|jgi:hypothetical protein|nr:hypothetical protein [Verrucomicrobiae bacterium]
MAPDDATLRARFDAEVTAAGLTVTGRDRELLFAMWLEHLPQREALRAAALTPEDEPWR